MTRTACRPLVAIVAVAVVLGACTIEQDLTPRVDAAPHSGSEDPREQPASPDPADDARAQPGDGGATDPSEAATPGADTPADRLDDAADAAGDPASSADTTTDPGPGPAQGSSPDPANRAPSASADAASTAEDTPVRVGVLANDHDPDGDALTLASVNTPANGVARVSGGDVVYTPSPDFHGGDTFTYVVSDGRGGTDAATVTITVRPVNDRPVGAADGPYLVQQGAALILTDLLDDDGDPDGDSLAIAQVTDGTHGTVSVVDDTTVEYVHDGSAASGDDVFTYRVTDGTAMSAPIDVRIDVNRRPVVRDDAMTVQVGGSNEVFSFNVITGAVGTGCCSSRESWSGSSGRDTDPDGDALAYIYPRSLSQLETWMTSFSCDADGWCRIGVKACTGLAEPYTFDYITRDARGGQDAATVAFRPLRDCIR